MSDSDASSDARSAGEGGRRLSQRVKTGMARMRRRLQDLDALGADDLKNRLAPANLTPTDLRERLDRIDGAFLDDGAGQTSPADVERVVERAGEIEARFQNRGPLARLLDDGRLLLALVRDAWSGRYREVPTWTLTAAAFTLLYVLNPMDLIPDALPVVGVIDDAAVVSLALVLLEQDLQTYRQWRDAADESADELAEGSAGEEEGA